MLTTQNDKLDSEVTRLLREVEQKDGKIYNLEAELRYARNSLKDLPYGTTALNHQLSYQKPFGD